MTALIRVYANAHNIRACFPDSASSVALFFQKSSFSIAIGLPRSNRDRDDVLHGIPYDCGSPLARAPVGDAVDHPASNRIPKPVRLGHGQAIGVDALQRGIRIE